MTGRAAIPAVVLTLLAGAGYAQAAALPSDPLPRFVRAGGGFTCQQSAADYERFKGKSVDLACMKIGPLALGSSRAEIERALKQPETSIADGGRENFVYALQVDPAGDLATYIVATYAADGRADMLQLSGAPWLAAWRFSGVALGDTEQFLRQRFGDAISKTPGGDPGTLQWNYGPWGFSFEVTAGVVSSIRVSQQ